MYLCTIATLTEQHQFLSRSYPKNTVDNIFKNGYAAITKRPEPQDLFTLYVPLSKITSISVASVPDSYALELDSIRNIEQISISADVTGATSPADVEAAIHRSLTASLRALQQSRDRHPTR